MAKALIYLAVLAALAMPMVMAFEKDEGVIVGTDDNLEEILKTHDYALVEFYAPWCGHCKSLAPEYAKAAQQLDADKSPVVLVKVDATVHSKTAEQYEVGGYPTLKFFKKGKASDYSGGRTASDIVAWVSKKSGPPAISIDSVSAAKSFAEKNEVAVLGVFDSTDSAEAKAFVAAAESTELPFGISTTSDVAKEYGVKVPAVVVLKSFDDGNAVYSGKFEAEDISTFASGEALPLVIEFSEANAPKIFGGSIKTHLLLFAKASAATTASNQEAMRSAAKENKGKIIFIFMDADKEDNVRIMDYFGITAGDLPTLRLINLQSDMAKYKPAFTEITADNIKKFCSDYHSGSLKRHLMSAPVPEDWNAQAVKVLTGGNFKEVALDSSKWAFVEFYAPWCGHCKQLTPIWDKLGEAFEGVSDVVIAKLDSTANELEEVRVESFPTIKLFAKGTNEIIDYEGERTLEGFVKFLNEKAGTNVEAKDDGSSASEQEAEYEDDVESGGDGSDGHDEL